MEIFLYKNVLLKRMKSLVESIERVLWLALNITIPEERKYEMIELSYVLRSEYKTKS